jgi:tRNA(Arg) A34 adenosine deaminase TadA
MALHLPHAEGGFGVTLNDITKHATFYTTTSRFVPCLGASPRNVRVCGLWLPMDALQDPSRSHGHRPHFSSVTSTQRFYPVTLNNITKDTAFYTTTSHFVPCLGAYSQERQGLWVVVAHGCSSGPVPESWSSSPLLLLRGIHSKLLPEYNCKEG